MRLDKYLAHASGASRKQVKQWVKAGQVTVDREVVTDAGHHTSALAQVCLRGQPLQLAGLRYLMLNKPAGTVSTAEHADERSVFALLPAAERRALHVVGRLDVDTTGLLLLTDDGQWSHRITAPVSHCHKVYRVGLSDPLSAAAGEKLLSGVQLNDEKRLLRARALHQLGDRCVDITLGEGRYHQVKRMFAAVGNHVESLHRLQIGALRLDEGLAIGQWRALSEIEVSAVFDKESAAEG